jgi:twitching motility two-component system response regulator PilG
MTSFILIIDDSVCVRKIVEITLRREGYATLGFADGITALRWLASEEAQVPALIFLDLTLPKMDGYTVLLHLKKRAATAHIPVVILSNRTGVIDRLKGRLAGACVYLTKPFHQQSILAVVRAQLASSVPVPVAIAHGTVRPTRPPATPHAAVRPITLLRMEG